MSKIFKSYKFIFDNLSQRNKRDLYILSIFVVLSFIIEIIQLSSLRLFIKIIESKSSIQEISNSEDFVFLNEKSLLTIGIIFFILLICCTISRIFTIKYSLKTASNISCDISNLIYRRIIKSPYFWQLKNSDSFSLAVITKDAENLMYLLSNTFTYLSHFFLISLIFCVLLIVNPLITLSIVIPVSLVYLLLYLISRKRLFVQGKKNVESNQAILKISLNSLAGIKNLIIDNSFSYFLEKYRLKVQENRSSYAKIQFAYQYPKVLIEFTIILTLIIVIFLNYENLNTYENYWSELISITFGVFRLINPLQIFFVSYSRYGEYRESLIRTEQFYKNKDLNTDWKVQNYKNVKLLKDKNKIIEIRNLSFSYPNTTKVALKKINFEAYKGETIAIVGKSGSGKSTFMDILMGLILPSEGSIYFNIDNLKGSKDILSRWQEKISFVPQKVFIIEDTVASNIAFGIPKNEINYKKVRWAAEKVQLSKRILDLPDQYNEFLLRDEKSNFSGGEAQKLGIARGLYRDRKILFFDEITNSLDQSSENQIISLIRSLNPDATKFIISHNMNKINYVDRIIVFKNGTIDAIDTYQNLIKSNDTFKQLKEESYLKNKFKELDI